MIRVLIVDDEVHCAEGVRCSTDWDALGVDQVFTAYSMKQAVRVLEQEEIEIVLTDVEMPKGSGLDLLAWIKEQGKNPVTILLTSYAQFNYAKQAIELGVMDYLLKPIDPKLLYAAFEQAVERVKQEREKTEIHKRAEYWTVAEKERQRTFWRKVLEREISPDSEAIREQAAREHLVFHENHRCIPVMFRIYLAKSLGNWLTNTQELKEEMQNTVFSDWSQVIPVYREDRLLAISEQAGDLEAYRAKLEQNCMQYMKNCQNRLGIVMSCYIGEFREPGELALQYELLEKADANNVAERPGIYGLEEAGKKLPYERPDIDAWIHRMAKKEYEKAGQEIERYVDRMAHERKLDKAVLGQLCHDFTQGFYRFLDEKGLQAHLLLEDEESMNLYQRRTATVREFKEWVSDVIRKASSYLEMIENSDTVVSRVKRYIHGHLGEELSRNQLAGQVFMSADYLSRVFQQETGIKLSEYITRTRMEKAAQLLEETDMTVGDIADAVGYGNLAYFTKVFRERNQTTPAQYRAGKRGRFQENAGEGQNTCQE
ncbi:MAG: response regulator [Candidatus Limivivens sp.]|nr:response regulator [Candidatus Limivivens sp.]